MELEKWEVLNAIDAEMKRRNSYQKEIYCHFRKGSFQLMLQTALHFSHQLLKSGGTWRLRH